MDHPRPPASADRPPADLTDDPLTDDDRARLVRRLVETGRQGARDIAVYLGLEAGLPDTANTGGGEDVRPVRPRGPDPGRA